MRRREFIALAAGATVARVAIALAQHKAPVIGILSPAPIDGGPLFDAFRGKLRDLGYVEGLSIKLDFHLARGQPEAIPGLS